MNDLLTPEEANALIDRGCVLHIAGDERALKQLHRGNWIGGTTPYILTANGGITEREKVFVTELPVRPGAARIRFVDIGHIPAISVEAPRNGFSVVIVPGMSDIHSVYSLTAAVIPGMRDVPIMGWVSGVHLDERGSTTSKVFNGLTGEMAEDRIVVIHCDLPPSKEASVAIVNLVKPGGGDEFVFDAPSFEVTECEINGERQDFYAYAVRNNVGFHHPLVTRLNGEDLSVALKGADPISRTVRLFAPVMQGRVYRFGEAPAVYRETLIRTVEERRLKPVLSFNCFHNFAYGGLAAPQAYPLPGPAVFGELAHVLMNQTLVCLSVKEK